MSRTIRLSYAAGEFVLRQTPGSTGRWGTDQFVTGSMPGEKIDAWFVYDSLPFPQTADCDPGRTVFVTGEPSSIRSYDQRFLAQFAAVVSPQTTLDHPQIFRQQPAIPWWVGINVTNQPDKTTAGCTLDYDRLKAVTRFAKPKLASIVCSDKSTTDGHRQRLAVVDRLRKECGNEIDFFGHGSRPVADKWDAIEPYRFHLVFENVRATDYWSEKLADTFLAGAVPIYCGCPSVADYFPANSLVPVDRGNPDRLIEIVRRTLAADDFDSRRPAVAEARSRVLDGYNLFPSWSSIADRLPPTGAHRRITLRPESDFVDPIRLRIKRSVKRLAFGVGARSG